jgi:ribosome biogenesis protein YTM1
MGASADGKLLLTGHPDHQLRLWDTRADGDVAASAPRRLKSHSQWVSSVSWSSANEHWALSASHDGCIKMWDVRSSIPLHTIVEIPGKALCAGWHGADTILGGGTDCQVHVKRVQKD